MFNDRGRSENHTSTQIEARKQELAARGSSPVNERVSWGGVVGVCLRCCQVKLGKDASVGMTTLVGHMTPSRKKLEPPDGGWGWMVVVGVAITNLANTLVVLSPTAEDGEIEVRISSTNQSIISLFGLLFGDTLEHMGYGTTGAAVITTVMTAVTNFSGLVTGPIIRRYSYRKAAVVGGLLTAAGMILTCEVTSIWHMIFSYGVLAGLGLGFLAPCTFVAVNTYFTTRKGRAVGLSLAGTGLGQMIMPHAVRLLLEEYGFRGTVLFIGGLSLHALVGAALFQPVEWHMKVREAPLPTLLPGRYQLSAAGQQVDTEGSDQALLPAEDKPSLTKVTSNPKLRRNVSSLSLASVCSVELGDVIVDKEETKPDQSTQYGTANYTIDKEGHPEKPDKNPGAFASCMARMVDMMDLDLLSDPVFVNIVVGLAVVYTAGINFSMIYPFYLHMDVGMTLADTATCMSVLAAFDILSRLIVPQITDRLNVGSRITYLVAAVLLAASRSALATTKDFKIILVTLAFCGFVRGVTVVNLNLSISEYCSNEKLPAALGINMVIKGVFILAFGPLLGYLRDETAEQTDRVVSQDKFLPSGGMLPGADSGHGLARRHSVVG
uniref:Major facilitator superfamily (MFS) profile domain-containing protein n=1 Tax=Timema bartmani TaxID=61472 RepID=A0A7R9EM67_9NEOP|nr:unnamed protein product [Timema bartmani]